MFTILKYNIFGSFYDFELDIKFLYLRVINRFTFWKLNAITSVSLYKLVSVSIYKQYLSKLTEYLYNIGQL